MITKENISDAGMQSLLLAQHQPKYMVGQIIQFSYEPDIKDKFLVCNIGLIIGIAIAMWHTPELRTVRYIIGVHTEPLKAEKQLCGGLLAGGYGKTLRIGENNIVKLL